MKVIVIGAGMGGLSAAIALRNDGHDVEVFEKVRSMRPVGAAISVWPNGAKALNFLGLRDQAAALGGNLRRMGYRDGVTGEEMCHFSMDPLIEKAGQKPYPMARAALQDMLRHEFGVDRVHLGKSCTGVEETGGVVRAFFEDGSTATADLLIAADGTHSRLRSYVLGHERTRRTYRDYVNFNGLVEIDPVIGAPDSWTTYVGEGKRVSVMPVADNRFYFFFDVPLPEGTPDRQTERVAELREHFGHWCQPVQRLIAALDPARTNRVEIADIEPFDQWVRGRVALLGDAAHSTTPDIGQGGCQAMEDAVVLSLALKTSTISVEDSLRRYQQRRAHRAGELVLRARKRSLVTHGANPEQTAAWYDELRREDGATILDGIFKNVAGNPLDA
ncbi:FAD-dependent urate hydroxylase HpxO [Kocuria sp. JC486]|uniref:FAD-dependent urate hydroxylase HpxO n=1 Tax=Kocuria sp. JC486 TaxID=1970736 RepID=UPI00141F922D|nr:FAD-dependent urate hydroxylase HpxO [Kocuria sp. JC486]